jgi:CRP-like cAMP-binding protein
MAMLSSLDLILRVPLFGQLTKEQADSLAHSVVKKRFKRGDSIVEQGKNSNALFIILNGRARVVMKDRQDREVILATLREGDCIGEMSLIDSQAHSATVSAEIVTDVLVLDRDNFMQCLQENNSTAMAVMRGLVQRLRSADRKIGSLALTGVYARVANALIDSAETRADGVLAIKDKVSRQDIAKMVGASREMVSRVMKEFEEQGFIETLETGSVLIRDRRTKPR